MYKVGETYHKTGSSVTYRRLLSSYQFDGKVFLTWEVRQKHNDLFCTVETREPRDSLVYVPYKKPVVHERWIYWMTHPNAFGVIHAFVYSRPDHSVDGWTILKKEKVTYTEE